MADRPRDHFIVYFGLPEAPTLYVLKRSPVGTVKQFTTAKHADINVVRKYIPEGYANTGVPDGPSMVEVWVHAG